MQVNILSRADISIVDVLFYFRDGTNYGFTTRTQGHSYYGALEPMNHNAHHIVGRKMYEVKKILVRYDCRGNTVEYEHFPAPDEEDVHIRLTGRSLGEELLRNKALEAVKKYG